MRLAKRFFVFLLLLICFGMSVSRAAEQTKAEELKQHLQVGQAVVIDLKSASMASGGCNGSFSDRQGVIVEIGDTWLRLQVKEKLYKGSGWGGAMTIEWAATDGAILLIALDDIAYVDTSWHVRGKK